MLRNVNLRVEAFYGNVTYITVHRTPKLTRRRRKLRYPKRKLRHLPAQYKTVGLTQGCSGTWKRPADGRTAGGSKAATGVARSHGGRPFELDSVRPRVSERGPARAGQPSRPVWRRSCVQHTPARPLWPPRQHRPARTGLPYRAVAHETLLPLASAHPAGHFSREKGPAGAGGDSRAPRFCRPHAKKLGRMRVAGLPACLVCSDSGSLQGRGWCGAFWGTQDARGCPNFRVP